MAISPTRESIHNQFAKTPGDSIREKANQILSLDSELTALSHVAAQLEQAVQDAIEKFSPVAHSCPPDPLADRGSLPHEVMPVMLERVRLLRYQLDTANDRLRGLIERAAL